METNYINVMGRPAEAEGAGQLYRDLPMKLFIDPAEMQDAFDASPDWLQQLMVVSASLCWGSLASSAD